MLEPSIMRDLTVYMQRDLARSRGQRDWKQLFRGNNVSRR